MARHHAKPNNNAKGTAQCRSTGRVPEQRVRGAFFGRAGRLRALLAAALLLGGAAAGMAIDPSTPLASYARQTWVMENGLPQNTVQALAQTRDGYLWLGTEAGLVRFDGVAFQVFDRSSNPALPSGDISCLLAAPDGALWIGTGAGLARWMDGAVTVFTTQEGLPSNDIDNLSFDGRGLVVVSTANGDVAMGKDGVVPLALDHPESPNAAASPVFAVRLSDGTAVQATTTEVEVMLPRKQARLRVGAELPGSRIQAVFADRQGALWIGTNGGLARWVKGKVERLPETDPLASASVLAVMEDREGDVWVGTETDGLHILRDQRFRTFGMREGLSSDRTTAVTEDRAGTLWVGTQEDGLNAVRRGAGSAAAWPRPGAAKPGSPGVADWSVRGYSVADGLVSNVILSLAAAPNGDVWVGTPDGLNRIHAGRIDTYTSADGLPDDFIRSLLVDDDGSLWIGTRHGLTHWKLGGHGRAAHMETYTQANGLGSDLVGAMARDRNGDLWIATLAGLSRLHQGTISNYTTANGLTSNVITALEPRRNGTLLIGTQDHGWDVWDGRTFSSAMNNGPEQAAIHAILDDGEGHLWFATGNGIARCDCTAMHDSMQRRAGASGSAVTAACSRWMEFGAADGLRSRETATNSHPSAWRSRDGHLWFATPRGLVEVDPAHFPVNTLPPPVALERFAVDDADQPLRGANPRLSIPAGRVHFEFDYAGLSFVAPQKVRYRYILEGFDRAWTDAGARRSAYFTNIPPGRYTFRVQAANNDGVWNTAGASLDFELRPHYYQTLWFYALLLSALAGTVLLLLRRRLRLAEREFRAVLGERSRIAREIHDTLAQGYVGISVQLEVLAGLLRSGKTEAAAKHLDQTREQVREGLADARQSIWALRTQDAGEVTLPVRLRRVVEAADGNGLRARFSTFGAYRPLPAATETELMRVAQEAIHNVKKHAGAMELSVQLEYGPDTIALEVRDDGRGGALNNASDRERGASPGHFGLTGMRERAQAIGGTLEVSSAPGEGTAVRLCAPAPREPQARAGEPH